MKVHELIAALQQCPPDDDVEIPVLTLHVRMGGHPGMTVTGAYAGFDWDHGTTFIESADPLYPTDDAYFQDRKTLMRLQETIYYIQNYLKKRSTGELQDGEILDSIGLMITNRLSKLK